MDKVNVNRVVTKQRPTRSLKKRSFLRPYTSTKASFLEDLSREGTNVVRFFVKNIVQRQNKSKGDDRYKKDDILPECQNKMLANKFFSRHAKKGNTCLVLDGKKVRTTKHLLKAGVASIHIPNNSPAFTHIQKYSKDKANVEAFNCSLYEFIKSTKDRYDVIYMDTCGMFKSTAKDSLKRTIKKCFYRNLLKDGGIFGVTITSRTNGQIRDAVRYCDDWVVKQSGLTKVFVHKYGCMTTMIYR